MFDRGDSRLECLIEETAGLNGTEAISIPLNVFKHKPVF
jgi:hypothetical protein